MEEQAKQQLTVWQKVRRQLTVIGIIAACIGVVLLIFIVVRLYGTGFTGKTLWDWLGLLAALAIPVVVGFGAAWFTHAQQVHDQNLAEQRTRNENELADKRAAYEQEINIDKLREELLQKYFDDMSELLLKKEGLLTSEPFSPIATIARARTLAVLHRVTATRKGLVLQFLQESKLIDKDKRIVDLRGADLSRADLQDADLRGADLSGTNLSEAKLARANLSEANLKDAKNITADELEKQAKSLKGAIMPNGKIHP